MHSEVQGPLTDVLARVPTSSWLSLQSHRNWPTLWNGLKSDVYVYFQ